ncbi:O-acetylhomoserine aminocarboxypropyltransferase/cysteine synthase family protein [Variovorax terrae]|uniref:O-acetylhomoserine aminocarboxypropyltransferase/cysteine synthase n=1 Tax=Variovorax terrae TaxID=2923278 RepID=A0A9X1VWG4_9BURK|nr:O-acetylhomoserine aminocarboxypropyltransferase/cysteine synthase family protein [Variovorax terrae]MCJ0764500.1 O-acetylhomoserine aminocarboxypropyltransferase/cysteine synthase [Variovorax terrae]
MDKYWRFETAAVHAGYEPSESQTSVAPPIYQTAAFAFNDAQHAVDLFDGRESGPIYSRIANPTVQMLEARVATLEQGVGATAVASGQAALACAFLTLTEAGSNIVSASSLYGTTYNLLGHLLPQYGIKARFADSNDLNQFQALVDGDTRAVFCETIANPAGDVADIEALANLAHERGVPLIVDNTVATPYLCQPLSHGADIVVHSLTKYMGGHGAALGGAVVDGGKFPWDDHPRKFSRLTAPDDSHHQTSFTQTYGHRAYIARCASVPLRNLGAVMAPATAISIMQGIETLALRMERICFNATLIAGFLQQHPCAEWVRYAGLPNYHNAELVKKYLNGQGSGVLSFGIKGGASAGAKFQDALRLIRRSVNLGDCKTLACHPASTTHRQLSDEGLAKSGVTDDLIRLSIGIEHVDDLLSDLDQALAGSQR